VKLTNSINTRRIKPVRGPFFSLKLKESRMLEYRGSPGDPQAFQEIHRLFRRSTGFPGDPLAFQEVQILSRRPAAFAGFPQPFQEVCWLFVKLVQQFLQR
jgi:hypothetical protein